MDKVLSTVLLVIAAVVTAAMVINAVYPAVGISVSALNSVSAKAADRVRSQASIIHAVGELDQNGNWQDTNSNGTFDIFIWVKNTGTITIDNMENGDVFLGSSGNWVRVPHEDYAGGTYPRWNYTVENGSEWMQAATLKICLSYNGALPSGEYRIKIIIPNGIADEYIFSM